VAEAAAIGLPDATWGERVVAVVVLKEGTSLTLDPVRRSIAGAGSAVSSRPGS